MVRVAPLSMLGMVKVDGKVSCSLLHNVQRESMDSSYFTLILYAMKCKSHIDMQRTFSWGLSSMYSVLEIARSPAGSRFVLHKKHMA
jgi:hypothetical protein